MIQSSASTPPTQPPHTVYYISKIQYKHLLEALDLLYASRGLCGDHTDQFLHALVLAQELEKSANSKQRQ